MSTSTLYVVSGSTFNGLITASTITSTSTLLLSRNGTTAFYADSTKSMIYDPTVSAYHLEIPDNNNRYMNPTGTIIMYAGTSAPSGYLLCDGATYTMSGIGSYADLFKVINYTYGGSGGLGYFRVPNLCDKFARGITTPSNLTSSNLGGSTTGGSYTIYSTQLPDHTHSIPSISIYWNENNVPGGGGSGSRLTSLSNTATSNFITYSNLFTGNPIETNGQPYYQPYTLVNYIIKY